ncbi:hypothetical protein D3C87_888330 [compost metagenome]
MSTLPLYLLQNISSYLPGEDIVNVSLTTPAIAGVVKQNLECNIETLNILLKNYDLRAVHYFLDTCPNLNREEFINSINTFLSSTYQGVVDKMKGSTDAAEGVIRNNIGRLEQSLDIQFSGLIFRRLLDYSYKHNFNVDIQVREYLRYLVLTRQYSLLQDILINSNSSGGKEYEQIAIVGKGDNNVTVHMNIPKLQFKLNATDYTFLLEKSIDISDKISTLIIIDALYNSNIESKDSIFITFCLDKINDKDDLGLADVISKYVPVFIIENEAKQSFINSLYRYHNEITISLMKFMKFESSFIYENFDFVNFFEHDRLNFILLLPGIWDMDSIISFASACEAQVKNFIGNSRRAPPLKPSIGMQEDTLTKEMYELNTELWYKSIDKFVRSYKLIECFTALLYDIHFSLDLSTVTSSYCDLQLLDTLVKHNAYGTETEPMKEEFLRNIHPYVLREFLKDKRAIFISTFKQPDLNLINDKTSYIDYTIVRIPREITLVQSDPIKIQTILDYYNLDFILSGTVSDNVTFKRYDQLFLLSKYIYIFVTDYNKIDTPEARLIVMERLINPNFVPLEFFVKLCTNGEVDSIKALIANPIFQKQRYIDYLGNLIDYIPQEVIEALK